MKKSKNTTGRQPQVGCDAGFVFVLRGRWHLGGGWESVKSWTTREEAEAEKNVEKLLQKTGERERSTVRVVRIKACNHLAVWPGESKTNASTLAHEPEGGHL